MTITIQIAANGSVPIQEHKDELRAVFAAFSEKEVLVSIKELTPFEALISEAVELQNKFSKMVNAQNKTFTNEDFSALRAKMSSASYLLFDAFAEAKSDEKVSLTDATFALETKKIAYLKQGDSPTFATSQAKISTEYTDAQQNYLQKYKIRAYLELLIKSLDSNMNAIAGIQKHDVNKLKF